VWVQFPKSVYCVNPESGAAATQADHPIADETGTVRTWTADHLTFDMNPPADFGMVEFGAGGRAMGDFTDVVPETLDVGTPVTPSFVYLCSTPWRDNVATNVTRCRRVSQ